MKVLCLACAAALATLLAAAFPSSALLKTKVEVWKIGDLSAPSESCGS